MLESLAVQIRQYLAITRYCDIAELTISVRGSKGVNGFVKRSLGFADSWLISNDNCEGR